MTKTYSQVAVLVFALLMSSCISREATAYHKVLRMSDGKVVTFGEMIDDLKRADIIFVGEAHDSIRDHAAEFDIVSTLHEQDVPIGMGLEMFRADSQETLDKWKNGTLNRADFIRSYYDNWRMPWPYYEDILLYAREHAIPLAGLNVPEAISRKVAAKGFSSLTPAERAQLPPGVSCNVDKHYMDFIRRVYESHAAGERSFVNFCEAQMLWDKSMAWNLVRHMKKHPGQKMVVLSGIGHAWKRGVPEQIRQSSAYKFKVVLPALPDETKRSSITAADTDYIFID